MLQNFSTWLCDFLKNSQSHMWSGIIMIQYNALSVEHHQTLLSALFKSFVCHILTA